MKSPTRETCGSTTCSPSSRVDEPDVCAGNLLPDEPDVCAGELFISAAGVRYPDAHVDTHLTRAWITQLAGEKRLYLWAPPDALEERVVWAQHTEEIHASTDLATLFDRPLELITLRAGQTAILPPGWMHTTETQALSVSVSGKFLLEEDLPGYRAFCAAVFDPCARL